MINFFETRHANPLVTGTLFLIGRISLFRAIQFWIAQVLGAMLGCGAVFVSVTQMHSHSNLLWRYHSAPEDVNVWMGFTMEVVLSTIALFVLMIVVFQRFVDGIHHGLAKVSAETHEVFLTPVESNSLFAGFVVASCCTAGQAISGGYANPLILISLGFISGSWSRIPIYIFAEGLGVALAAVLVRLFQPNLKEDNE